MKDKNKKAPEEAGKAILDFLASDQISGIDTGVSVEIQNQLMRLCESYELALQRVDHLEQELHARKADAKVQRVHLKETVKAVLRTLKASLPKKAYKKLAIK